MSKDHSLYFNSNDVSTVEDTDTMQVIYHETHSYDEFQELSCKTIHENSIEDSNSLSWSFSESQPEEDNQPTLNNDKITKQSFLEELAKRYKQLNLSTLEQSKLLASAQKHWDDLHENMEA